jgi:hypothetical protein
MAREFPLSFTAPQWAAVREALDGSEDEILAPVKAELDSILTRMGELDAKSKLFIVRHYDGFDHDWIDVSKPVEKGEADRILAEKTDGGRRNVGYNNIDYYRIFPADTRMLHSGHD